MFVLGLGRWPLCLRKVFFCWRKYIKFSKYLSIFLLIVMIESRSVIWGREGPPKVDTIPMVWRNSEASLYIYEFLLVNCRWRNSLVGSSSTTGNLGTCPTNCLFFGLARSRDEGGLFFPEWLTLCCLNGCGV